MKGIEERLRELEFLGEGAFLNKGMTDELLIGDYRYLIFESERLTANSGKLTRRQDCRECSYVTVRSIESG